jgi:hypothetical protein
MLQLKVIKVGKQEAYLLATTLSPSTTPFPLSEPFMCGLPLYLFNASFNFENRWVYSSLNLAIISFAALASARAVLAQKTGQKLEQF